MWLIILQSTLLEPWTLLQRKRNNLQRGRKHLQTSKTKTPWKKDEEPFRLGYEDEGGMWEVWGSEYQGWLVFALFLFLFCLKSLQTQMGDGGRHDRQPNIEWNLNDHRIEKSNQNLRNCKKTCVRKFGTLQSCKPKTCTNDDSDDDDDYAAQTVSLGGQPQKWNGDLSKKDSGVRQHKRQQSFRQRHAACAVCWLMTNILAMDCMCSTTCVCIDIKKASQDCTQQTSKQARDYCTKSL